MRTLVLLSYAVLVSALMISSGLYNRMALLLVMTSFFLLLAAAKRFYCGEVKVDGQSLESWLTAALLFSIGYWFIGPTSTDPHPAWFEDLATGFAGTALLGVLLGYVLRRRWPRARRWLLGILGILPVILWFLLPRALPAPPIDVYDFHQRAATQLISGVNPYSVNLGTLTYFSKPSGYQYPPGNLYPVGLAVWLGGDVRYGQALLMVVTAVLLWLTARRRLGDRSAEMLSLLFLYHPRGIFVLDHSFTETILIAPLALFVFLLVYRRLTWLAALVFGFFVSLKPYLVFLPLPWLMIERRPRYLILGAVGALAPMLPFLMMDFVGTIYNGFFFVLLHGPFRTDSLSVTSLLFELCHCRVPVAGWSLLVGVVATTLTFWFLRKKVSLVAFLYAAVVVMFSIFFLGSIGMGGYYYLVTVMLLLLLAVGNPGEYERA